MSTTTATTILHQRIVTADGATFSLILTCSKLPCQLDSIKLPGVLARDKTAGQILAEIEAQDDWVLSELEQPPGTELHHSGGPTEMKEGEGEFIIEPDNDPLELELGDEDPEEDEPECTVTDRDPQIETPWPV